MPFDSQAYLSAMGGAANNIAGIGNSLAQGIKNYQQEKKDDKAARAVFDALSPNASADGSTRPHPFGISKDEFDGMSRRDRIGFVSGAMQAQHVKEFMDQARERQDEAEAWDKFSGALSRRMNPPAPQDIIGATAGATNPELAAAISPGVVANFMQQQQTPNAGLTGKDIMAAMAEVGRTNPRLSSSLARSVLPEFMRQTMNNGDEKPMPWTSPQGNPYVSYHHTLIPDRSGVNVQDFMSQLPENYNAVPDGKGGLRAVPKPAAKNMHATIQSMLLKHLDDYASGSQTAASSDEELKNNPAGLTPQQLRDSASRRMKAAQQAARNLLTLQKQNGTVSDEEHDALLSQFGIIPKTATSTTAPAGTGAAQIREGQTITNPKTGERKIYKGGTWQTLTPPE